MTAREVSVDVRGGAGVIVTCAILAGGSEECEVAVGSKIGLVWWTLSGGLVQLMVTILEMESGE